MNARLFLALWPDAAVREHLAGWRDTWRWPHRATPVRSDRLHLTLHFIGDLPSTRVDEVADGLQVSISPFELHFGQNDLWPHGVAVLLPDRPPAALLDLQHALAIRLQALGLPLDPRSYRPHVTLARRAAGAAPERVGAYFRWPVSRYALMRSQPDGYDIVRAYPG